MKYLYYLLVFFLIQLTVVNGQNNDSIEDCIIKYKHINFLSVNKQIKPITLFMETDGNFFLRYGHVERPEKNEEVVKWAFNKKGKLIKQCHEKYENANDSLTVIAINNYFPEKYYKSKSEYLKINIERYSILLQGFKEPFFYNLSDTNFFRIIFPCYDYISNLEKKCYQSYNLVRINFHKDNNILVYKTGHFDINFNFLIDFEYTYHLKSKEIKRILKKYKGIDLTDNNIYYKKNITSQRLFEFKNQDNYYLFLRANLYEEKFDNISYFIGLFNEIYHIIGKNIYEQIDKCQ